MYKVIMKFENVQIRFKNGAEIGILIKKADDYFIIKEKFSLLQGKSHIANNLQFFIEAVDPLFEVQVLIKVGEISKLAGVCFIKLTDWQSHVCHNSTSKLVKSPDSQARISYSFIYFQTNQSFKGKKLVTLQAMENKNQHNMVMEIQEKNNLLIIENNRLNEELSQLKQTNRSLQLKHKNLTQNLETRQQQYLLTLSDKQRKIILSKLEVEGERKKIGEIFEIIHQQCSGDIYQQLEYKYNIQNNIQKQMLSRSPTNMDIEQSKLN